jgi:hypothetical protein
MITASLVITGGITVAQYTYVQVQNGAAVIWDYALTTVATTAATTASGMASVTDLALLGGVNTAVTVGFVVPTGPFSFQTIDAGAYLI